ncbi:MAG: hypothetical protein E7079_03185 [Bacteroidales bacterium]|nr:hypothetical protein [Bacteroidales bacterium]
MKKFFTLCLAFMLASLLNVNAADTYTLVGDDVNGKSWDTSATINDFVYDSTTETYVLSGAKVNGEFKVVKNHNWGDGELAANPYNPNVLTNTAYRMYYNGQGGASSNANTKSALENCTVKLQFVGDDKTPFITFETESEQSWSWNDNVSTNWGIIGADELIGAWGPDVDLTCNYNSTYTWKTEKLPEGEFKFRENDAWTVNFGAGPVSNIDVNTEVSLGYNTGNMKFNTPTENYSFYVFTLTIRGGAAKLRVDGFKEIVGATEIFYESFDQCSGTGANDGNGFGDTNSGVASATFTADNDGWNASKKYAASKSAKFGNSTAGNGVVTSPALGLEGDGTLTFKAAPWNNDGTELNLSISSGTLSETKVTMTKGEWTEFTVKITGATADATLTFTPAKRFFLDEVKVTQGEGEIPTWAPVFNDVANGGIYYGNYVNYSVDAPGCDKLDLKFYKNGEFDWETSQPSQYLPYSNSANCATDDSWNNITTEHEIIATAYKGNEFYTTTIKFTVQPVESVKTLNEFIGTEGKRIFIQQMATVTYQSGKYLFLKDSSGAIVVYGDGLPTFEPGDLLQNFVAEYTNYNGLHEIIPVASSFKNAKLGNWGAPSPELITIDDVTVANQNKYVKLNGVALDNTAMTIGGVTLYNRFNVELPTDGKYNVVAIISYYNQNGVTDDPASVQLYPISFEEVPELVPTAVSPEDGAVTTLLETVTLTFSENVTLNTEAGEVKFDAIEYKYYSGVVSSVTAENNVVTFKLTTSSWDYNFTPGEKYRLTIPAGYIVGQTSNSTNAEYIYNWTYDSNPAYNLEYSTVTPVAGQVESISEISLIYPETVSYYYAANKPTLKDSEGNVVANGTYDIYDAEGVYRGDLIRIVLDKTVTTPGTYTLTIPQGAIGDQTAKYYYFSNGRMNPEINLTYTIPEPPITYTYVPTKTTPAEGNVEAPLTRVRLHFDDNYPDVSNGVYIDPTKYVTIVNQNGERVFEGIAKIGLSSNYYYVDITPNGTEGITTPGTYTFTIPAGCIGDEEIYNTSWKEGRVNPELTYTFTVKGPAMQVSAVAPEEGETADLNTITLTFPEATTFAAEASALTFHNDNYYTASVKSVVMSEDGLTATITSEAGYPGWKLGESYTLNIPEGAFVGASGAATEALSYTWTIAVEKFTYVSVTPAQGEVTELSEILICFALEAYGNSSLPTLNLIDEYGAVITTASTTRAQDADGNWYAIKATLAEKVTAAGTYILQVPEDVFKDTDFGDGNTNKTFNLKWTVGVAGPEDGFTYETITPDPSQEVSSIESVVVTFPADVTYDNSLVMLGTTAMTLMNTLTVTVEGNTVTFTPATPITAEGNHQLTWNEGAFTAANGAKCASATINYTVAKADPNTYTYELAADPANGSTLEALTTITFADASYATMPFLTDEAKNTQNWVVVEDAEGNTYNTTLENTTGVTIIVEGATAPGTYSVYVPAKTFYDMMAYSKDKTKYNYNPEMRLTYTIEAPAPEDFTPVVTPTAGSVEVKDLSSIVVTLPSEFGEFNPKCHSWYNQMYIKYYDESLGYDQEIWTNTNSSITVSEDGLSITLTDWAFEFEKGVTYKFNIPAGYIVLANGAKNAETCIEYVISEGPKDLAEFTVPAGINGYINYDETNINAWAPEFPFTASTTQNNTIAFSATLPSLPPGLTSMEVLDENGEVLVTLNQTGVAPLADGTEEYYVAGETTKEFVDGATLRFYFSFAHAGGISETIRFEYVVAGGTITGAEAITLDGNVIVRGNDIIAPEGSAIYTVSGIQVPAEGLAPGVYVVVYGNQAIKVMVK